MKSTVHAAPACNTNVDGVVIYCAKTIFVVWAKACSCSFQGRIQDFGQGGSGVLTPGGALSPKFAQNCLKTTWFWKILHMFCDVTGFVASPTSLTPSPLALYQEGRSETMSIVSKKKERFWAHQQTHWPLFVDCLFASGVNRLSRQLPHLHGAQSKSIEVCVISLASSSGANGILSLCRLGQNVTLTREDSKISSWILAACLSLEQTLVDLLHKWQFATKQSSFVVLNTREKFTDVSFGTSRWGEFIRSLPEPNPGFHWDDVL